MKAKWIVFVASFCLVFLNYGCIPCWIATGAVAGSGGIAYMMGELASSEAASLNSVWEASQTALDSLDFAITKTEKSSMQGKIVARGFRDKKITIKLKEISTRVTRIQIRVGIFGDEALSRQILDKIKSEY